MANASPILHVTIVRNEKRPSSVKYTAWYQSGLRREYLGKPPKSIEQFLWRFPPKVINTWEDFAGNTVCEMESKRRSWKDRLNDK